MMNQDDKERKKIISKLERNRQHGFTLIEILIVVAVMGILAAVIIPNISNISYKANVSVANTELQNVRTAALAYHSNKNEWPEDTTVVGFNTYINGELRAIYSFDNEGKITGVNMETVDHPWPETIIFDVDSQQWKKAETP
jgi:prepilin-type N-terminal cleavage/methylation domain-containing protein